MAFVAAGVKRLAAEVPVPEGDFRKLSAGNFAWGMRRGTREGSEGALAEARSATGLRALAEKDIHYGWYVGRRGW
jgi:hypothetical protein